MHNRLIQTLTCLFCLLAEIFVPNISGSAWTVEAAPVKSAYDLIDAVNSLRSSHGLPPYSISSILMGTAQAQADYMASIGSWTHTGPDGSSVTQRLLAAGYPLAGDLSLGGFRSENVIMGSGMTPAEAVSAWTGDDPHLHTMLSTDLLEIGAGVAEVDGVYYYVIDCARPTSSGLPQAYTPGVEAQYSASDSQFIVPVIINTPDEKGNIYHEVQQGQSLWQIAIEYKTTIAQIKQLNGLASNDIYPGDKLLVARVDTPTPIRPTETVAVSPPTVTPLPTAVIFTATPTATETPIPAAPILGPAGAGGAVFAIVLVALIAAGLVAWIGRSRPV